MKLQYCSYTDSLVSSSRTVAVSFSFVLLCTTPSPSTPPSSLSFQITFGMGYVFFTDPLYRLGLFTLGCSPGGMMSNFWTLMFGGDINLSITMTAVSTVAAMGQLYVHMTKMSQLYVYMGENELVPRILGGKWVSSTYTWGEMSLVPRTHGEKWVSYTYIWGKMGLLSRIHE